jgi:hypothetical protein
MILDDRDLYKTVYKSKKFILILIAVLMFGCGINNIFAQTNSDVSFVPLIGITSVPEPLSLPKEGGSVTYSYAVKNFIKEAPLTDIKVVDDKCSSIKFVTGDDNGDYKLDYNETWRYICTTKIYSTTESIATATGVANNMTATHNAYTTVVVGLNNPPPLVSIINITKVAYPLTLPAEGGDITFTYRVNNPGIVPLSDVSVTDDKCSAMSQKLGDLNGNNFLDTNEVWVYTCMTHLNKTTTNTVSVTSFANGLKAVGYATITVTVANPSLSEVGGGPNLPDQAIPSLPETGVNPNLKIIVWAILSGVLSGLIMFFILAKKIKLDRKP